MNDRGRHYDIIAEALESYDEWMKDDDYNSTTALNKIMKRMRERLEMTDAPDRAQAGQEPDAWQWRYVGDRCWKTQTGGLKLTPADMKNERPFEQRPLYASPQWQLIETAPKDGTDILVSCGPGHPTRLAFWDAARNNCWSVWPGRAWIAPLYWTPLPALTVPSQDRGTA